jgi:tyrosine-specific transport protein
MDFKLIGSILLIVGTSIGAGMLALPIATAHLGFLGALLLLFTCWFVMTAGAFLLLEVNLWQPQNTNLISMARVTIGPLGQIIAWITYLLLLYSLLCAYIAGGSDLLRHLFLSYGTELAPWLATLLFTLLFGMVVYLGIRSVDYLNRGLMLIKMGAYLLLVFCLTPYISLDKLTEGHLANLSSTTALTVTITSFGFAIIVPTLRIYFESNVKKLKIAILLGSLIPLLCYIAWDAAIMGVIPASGEKGLMAILQSKNSTSDLVSALNAATSHASVGYFAKLFTSICVLTSFLSVSLCLTDFLADGLAMEKKGRSGFFVHLLTFVPPLAIVLFFPDIFIKALEYAGIYCIVLLILLPAWMVWQGRYHRRFKGHFIVKGGRVLLGLLIVFALAVIAKSMF